MAADTYRVRRHAFLHLVYGSTSTLVRHGRCVHSQ